MVSKFITSHLSLLFVALVSTMTGLNGGAIPGNLGDIARTLASGSLMSSLPLDLWNMSEDLLPELMLKAAEWAETSNWVASLGSTPPESNNVTEGHREKRATGEPKFLDWVRAYRKDPEYYSCVRKIVCEMLAKSNLAEKSVKSPLGGTIMSMLGRAVSHGGEMVDLVTEVVGDPDKCLYYAPNELCD